VTRLVRWRLAATLAVVSLLCLGATVLGAWAYWPGDSVAERALTVVLLVLFAAGLALSVTIGVSRPSEETPWRLVGAAVVLLVVGWAVALLRRSLY
jgi:hypothetical protein